MNIPIYVKKGRNAGLQIGYFNEESKTYFKSVNFKSNQMLQHPKYIGQIAISQSTLGELQSRDCEKICIQVTGYEKRSFEIIISLNDFLKNAKEIEWDDPQMMCHMNKFKRVYPNQERLIAI